MCAALVGDVHEGLDVVIWWIILGSAIANLLPASGKNKIVWGLRSVNVYTHMYYDIWFVQ